MGRAGQQKMKSTEVFLPSEVEFIDHGRLSAHPIRLLFQSAVSPQCIEILLTREQWGALIHKCEASNQIPDASKSNSQVIERK